jgi:hypothetical protein
MIPIRRQQVVKPTPPTPLAGLTKGMARLSWSKGGREDNIDRPERMPRVPGYPQGVGPQGLGLGIQPTPPVPQAGGSGEQRKRFLEYVKSSKGTRRGGTGTGYDQLLQSVQGGGTPLGPAYEGYISQLARTLMQGM